MAVSHRWICAPIRVWRDFSRLLEWVTAVKRPLIAVSVGSAIAASSQLAQGAPRECGEPSWSAARPMTDSGGRPIYVERPHAMTVHTGIALLGTPSFLWAAPTAFDLIDSVTPQSSRMHAAIAGVVLQKGVVGYPVQLPPSARFMMSAHVVNESPEAVGVYWATAPNQDPSTVSEGNEVWHSRFDGSTWTPPERVFEAKSIHWTDEWASVIVGPNGAEIAAGAYTGGPTSSEGIVYIRRARDGWASSWIETHSLAPHDVASAVVDARTRLVVFSGSTLDQARQLIRGVFSSVSHDAGATWDSPHLVRASTGDTIGTMLVIARQAAGTLHLIWLDRTAGTRGRVLRHFVSHADASAWTPSTDLLMPTDIDLFSATAVGDEEVLVVAREAASGTVRIASWLNGRWSPLLTPFTRPAMSAPTLSVVDPKTVYLTWGVGHAQSIAGHLVGADPQLLLSVRSPSCTDASCCKSYRNKN